MWKNKNKTKKKYVLVEEGNLSKKKNDNQRGTILI